MDQIIGPDSGWSFDALTAAIQVHSCNVRFPPEADIGWPLWDVRFVPKADILPAAKMSLFDHLVGYGERRLTRSPHRREQGLTV